MLVVTRRVGQSVMIGEDVEIVVLKVDRSEIRIGIKAPRNVPVLRHELIEGNRHDPPASLPPAHRSHGGAAA